MRALIERLEHEHFDKDTLLQALRLEGSGQEALFALARKKRDQRFPAREVEVRSVVEISNICRQRCNYCGIGKGASSKRYIIGYDEFLGLAGYVHSKGRRVLLVQSGESRAQSFVNHVCRCVEGLKTRHADLVVILCLGNLSEAQYRQLKDAGAERYILKFESSNPRLYSAWKPRDTLQKRVECLETLQALGYRIGTGNMVGLPGQSIEDVADDLLFMGRFKLTMASCTVFIPGEESVYKHEPMGNIETTLNTLALMRIMYPDKLIPTTSSLEKAKSDGQYLGLMAGANTVTIHDGTPQEFKDLFPIYSSKRFAPNDGHIGEIVRKAQLRMATGALA